MKLLIADDEEYTRQGIRDSFDWEKLGFDSVRLAADGEEALRLARSFAPDLIITDVKMPRMNGIEFAREITRLLPRCKLLFISGYIEVDYFKSALKLEAVDYIVKPIDREELLRAIHKALDSLESQQRMDELRMDHRELKRAKLLHELTQGAADRETVREMGRELRFPQKGPFVCLVIRCGKDGRIPLKRSAIKKRLDKYGMEYLLDYVEDTGFVCVCCAPLKKAQAAGRALLEDPELYLGAGGEARGWEEIPASYAGALRSLEAHFFTPQIRWLESAEGEFSLSTLDSELFAEFTELMSEHPEGLQAWFDRLFVQVEVSRRFRSESIKSIVGSLLQMVVDRWKGSARYLHSVQQAELVREHACSLETFAALKDFTAEVLRAREAEDLAKNSYSRVVQSVLRYIEEHFSDCELSVQDVANHVHLSTTYISILFKKETQKTLKQYISDCRLDKAKRLLENEHYKVTDIAEMCGYANSNYFARVFRESEGMTPVEYREGTRR